MKGKVTDFIAEVSVRYSDDAGNAMEKRFNYKPTMTFDDFMTNCQEAYSMMRFTCGQEVFDELTKDEAKEPVVE